MNSKPPSDHLDLELDLPSDSKDRPAKARPQQTPAGEKVVDLDRLRADRLGDFRPGRQTSEGWEPFEL